MSKISIIIPVYNTEEYLPRCIKSVIRQTYENWELVLVDDGSKDCSGSICDCYAQQDTRIRVIHNQNQGPAASRESGIKIATGEFVMFVDSDDWLDAHMLQIMYQQIRESGAAIVCCLYQDITKRGKATYPYRLPDDFIDCMNVQDCMYQMHHTRYLTGSPCAKLFRRELFQNIDFCRGITIGEDYSMIVQLLEKAEHVRIISQALYFRFVRKGSISHGGYTERHRQAFDNYMRLRHELVKNYPKIAADIIAFHTEYEMAVITAMCRNDCYDRVVICKLRNDLKTNMKNTLVHTSIPSYMKGCAMMIAYMPSMFIVLFRILYHLTGR